MKDKYDEAIKYLTEHPDKIESAWCHPNWIRCGELFQLCGESLGSGCLTQIASNEDSKYAATPELTAAIRADKRIPHDVDDITVESLPVFAEWQRRLDKELNRS